MEVIHFVISIQNHPPSPASKLCHPRFYMRLGEEHVLCVPVTPIGPAQRSFPCVVVAVFTLSFPMRFYILEGRECFLSQDFLHLKESQAFYSYSAFVEWMNEEIGFSFPSISLWTTFRSFIIFYSFFYFNRKSNYVFFIYVVEVSFKCLDNQLFLVAYTWFLSVYFL